MLKYKIRKVLNILFCKKVARIYEILDFHVRDDFGGHRIKYNPSTDIGKSLFFSGEFEAEELELCSRFMEKDSVVLDVGANIGIHSISFSRLVPDGLVISFEPSRKTFDLLLNNTQGINNILPINIGISDKTQITKFYVASDDAYSGLKNTNRKKIQGEIFVLCMSMDDLLLKLSLKKIDFVKIDVEGCEKKVLNGMKNTIIKYRPVIFCEIYRGINSNEDPDGTVELLVNMYYDAYVIIDGQLCGYNKHNDAFYNYLFIPKAI